MLQLANLFKSNRFSLFFLTIIWQSCYDFSYVEIRLKDIYNCVGHSMSEQQKKVLNQGLAEKKDYIIFNFQKFFSEDCMNSFMSGYFLILHK